LPGGTEDHPPKKERKKKTWCSGWDSNQIFPNTISNIKEKNASTIVSERFSSIWFTIHNFEVYLMASIVFSTLIWSKKFKQVTSNKYNLGMSNIKHPVMHWQPLCNSLTTKIQKSHRILSLYFDSFTDKW
jgi:hypothetical protein